MSNINNQALKPGLYAVLYRDNWDGEGDTYEMLATLDSNLIWHDHESGKKLLEYEGDVVLKVWALDDGSNLLALLNELEAAEKRIAELEAREVTLPAPACTYADHSYPAYSERQVVALLGSLGIMTKVGE